MHDFDPEETQTDPSAPLVDYDSVDEERGQTPATQRTDMSTMPETRSAARSVLEREVRDRRGFRIARDGSAPLRRSATCQDRREARVSAPEPLLPRRPEDSRSLASSPSPTVGSIVLYYPDRALKGCDVPGPFPAIVTRVIADSGEEQLVNLQVFGSGLSAAIWNFVPHGGPRSPGSWSRLPGVA